MQQLLRVVLGDVIGPAARAWGFKGSAPTWRRRSDLGDWAIVNVQSSSSNTSNRCRCVINLAVAPACWLELLEHDGVLVPTAVPERLGLFRDRLYPTGDDGLVEAWWEITDQVTAESAVADMATCLETEGWPKLIRLLHRQSLLRQIRAGDLGFFKGDYDAFFAKAEALLLSDDGPSAALERAIAKSREAANKVAENRRWTTQLDWIRQRAADHASLPDAPRKLST